LVQSRVDALHDAMAARVDRGQLPGLVTVLACGDDVRIDPIGRFGVATGSPPMARDTIFRIASLTKPIVAATAMMLVEDGTLSLTDPIDRWLPELADRTVLRRIDGPLTDTVPADRPLTLDDLLTFRMGWGHITEPSFNPPYPIIRAADDAKLVMAQPDPRTPHDPDQWLKRFAALPLMEQPGTRWRYNVGTLVAGVLIARAAGRPLPQVMRERVFDPLGMADTGFHLPADQLYRLPEHYMSDQAGGPPRAQTATTPQQWAEPPLFPSGSAGLVSTVEDFLTFARLLRNDGLHGGQRLLSSESVAGLTTNHLTPDQIATAGVLLGGAGWGYGMAAVVSPTSRGMRPGQYGWSGGYGTDWFTDPGRDLIALAFSQTSDFLFNGGLTEFTALAGQAAG
jgi:CubicO group peptidase (beta-lactamase class C family)